MDRLSELLNHFSMTATVFYSGNLCAVSRFEDPDCQVGHIHILRSGRMTVSHPQEELLELNQPTILFYPEPTPHRIQSSAEQSAELVCAALNYGIGAGNSFAQSLPSPVVLPLAESADLDVVTELLFTEAFNPSQGSRAMINRLVELFLIQVFRHFIAKGTVKAGVLAGLADPLLVKVMDAIHSNAEAGMDLSQMANMAAMSRSSFAEHFRRVVGQSPGDYLMEWRVSCAQLLLKQGRPLSWIANQVGYASPSSLARAFRKKTGLSPGQWLQQFHY
ncbi:MAG: AraC family transcriptional regulator [Motiliproteus sp.]